MTSPTTPLAPMPDIRPARLDACQYVANFADAHPPLTAAQALIEADRCYYCFDAPCITACPTGIDIPSFIRRIGEGNVRGAARAILEANVFGGMCARVCPTEILCEDACVRNTHEDKPVEIGLLQRHATDHVAATPGAPIFRRAEPTGQRIAVVGAGPAGLSCAHRAALLGHAVTVFDAAPKPGGLNEYGLASYKTTDDFAQREVDWLLSIGGIELRHDVRLGEQISLAALAEDFDAVFLAIGLGGVNALGTPDESAAGVADAVGFIAALRQAGDLSALPVGRRVVVIGGGMTAVDAAVQSKKLGADEVTIVYRRDQPRMSASRHEQEWAQSNGVTIRTQSVLQRLHVEGGRVVGATFAVRGGDDWTIAADTVLKAIGQTLAPFDTAAETLDLRAGRIAVDDQGRTSMPKVWAGGDCTHGGRDLTVEAVEHGKIAAHSIHATLRPGAPLAVSPGIAKGATRRRADADTAVAAASAPAAAGFIAAAAAAEGT